MKKIFAFLMAMIMLLSLAACGSKNSSDGTNNAPDTTAADNNTPDMSNDPTPDEPSTPETKPIKVAIAHALTDDFTENLRKIEENMAADYGLEVTFTNAGGDASTQIANVESMIAQQPDVIVLRCLDAQVAETLVQMVHEAGIPCVVDETRPETNRDYDINVMGNQSVHGNLIGEYLQSYLDANPGVTLNMLYINGGTSDNIRKRMTGIFETCTNDRLVQIGDELGSWSASTAQEITEAYLTSHPEMNLICCANDEMALGVIETLKSAGKLGDIMVFGVDGSASGQASIKAGEMMGSTLNDVSIAVKEIYTVCTRLANGESVEDLYTNAEAKELDPKAYILLTPDNIDTAGTI